jgi:alpha-L-fucosidase
MADEGREWFKKARFGMFTHWGLYSITAKDMWYYSRDQVDQAKYESLMSKFNPVDYNPVEWAKLARRAGMKYAVITAKHHEGFCLWDSQYTDFKVTSTPYGKDILKPWVEAFRNEGLKVGFYYSLLDWHHPHFTVDGPHPQRARWQELNQGRDFSIYQQYMLDQITELMTNYGKIDIVWFDFSYGKSAATGLPGKAGADWNALALKRKVLELQPHALINNRLDLLNDRGFSDAGASEELRGDFATPEQYIPDDNPMHKDSTNLMWEACETIGASWGYFRGDRSIKPSDVLIRHLVTCVHNDGNLLLNVGPTPRGRIQPEFVERLEQMGRWLEINGESVYGAGIAKNMRANSSTALDCLFTQKGKDLYMHFLNGQYPPCEIVLYDLGGKVDHIELVSDKTIIEFEEVELDGRKNLWIQMPAIDPDPFDTVVRLELN